MDRDRAVERHHSRGATRHPRPPRRGAARRTIEAVFGRQLRLEGERVAPSADPPSGVRVLELVIDTGPTPGGKPPDAARAERAHRVRRPSQKLKSPTTETDFADGAQTANDGAAHARRCSTRVRAERYHSSSWRPSPTGCRSSSPDRGQEAVRVLGGHLAPSPSVDLVAVGERQLRPSATGPPTPPRGGPAASRRACPLPTTATDTAAAPCAGDDHTITDDRADRRRGADAWRRAGDARRASRSCDRLIGHPGRWSPRRYPGAGSRLGPRAGFQPHLVKAALVALPVSVLLQDQVAEPAWPSSYASKPGLLRSLRSALIDIAHPSTFAVPRRCASRQERFRVRSRARGLGRLFRAQQVV